MAMREHIPVESDKTYGFDGRSDEEVPPMEGLEKETSKVAETQATAQR
jgi:hypothetical protein